MWHKALWLRNWKNSKYIIYAIWLTLFIGIPIDYMLALSDAYHYENLNGVFLYQHPFDMTMPTIIVTLLLLFLAVTLTTMEYGNKNKDFHLSLPFSRRAIYFSKFAYGAIHVIVALAANILLTLLIIYTTVIHQYEINSYVHWGMFFLFASAGFIAIYSLALFIGTITGNKIAHFTITSILLFFVHGVILLLERVVYAHTGDYEHVKFYQIHDAVKAFTLPIKLSEYRIDFYYTGDTNKTEAFFVDMPTPYLFLSSAIITIVCVYFGQLAYKHTKSEYGGSALLFPLLHRPFIICTSLCFAFLGGFFEFRHGYLITNYFFFILFGLVTYFLLQRLFRKKQVA